MKTRWKLAAGVAATMGGLASCATGEIAGTSGVPTQGSGSASASSAATGGASASSSHAGTQAASSSAASGTGGAVGSGGAGGAGGSGQCPSDPLCGNGKIDGTEECDGTDFGGKTCATYSFGGGNLLCNTCCHIVVSECVPLEQCTNEIDDNNNGLIDCRDPECVGKPPCVDSCNAPYPAVMSDNDGDTTGRPFSQTASCSSSSPGFEQIFSIVATATGTLALDLDSFDGASFSLSVRTACDTASSEIACTNVQNPNDFGDVTLGVQVTSGQTYYLMVQGMTMNDFGQFDLNVSMTPPETICDDFIDNDLNGYTDCDDANCQTLPACVPGTAAVGAACSQNTDCAANENDPICLDTLQFPGGYCSEFCDLASDDCPTGSVCYGGLQLSTDGVCLQTCATDADCNTAAGYTCANVGLASEVCMVAETACNDYVDNNFNNLIDCQDPDTCQSLPACVPGTSEVGAPCTLNDACTASAGVNNPLCLDEANNGYPGGYCSHWCDPSVTNDCGANGTCVANGPNDGDVCMVLCLTNAQCRPGYSCQDLGFTHMVCSF